MRKYWGGVNMNQIKISIIIPVYNTGVYLEEALDSIYAQSFREYEVICVDDSSEDLLTRKILNNYQRKYKNMHVIRQKINVGAGEARNIGFLRARGEYVIFLDADDVFKEIFLEEMYRCIRVNNADVCICGHEEFYIRDGIKYYGPIWNPDKDKVNDDSSEEWLMNISTAAWDKLCRTQFLKENNIHFQSLDSCNDVLFACRVMMNARKKCYIEEVPLIYYRTKTGRQISAKRNPLDLYKAMKLLYEIEGRKFKNDLLQLWIGSILIRNGIGEMDNCSDEGYKQQYYDLLYRYFTEYTVFYQHNMLEACVERIRFQPCKSDWICNGIDLLSQLRMTAGKLKKEINGENNLFLWGLGYRGHIFQLFCKEEGIILQGTTDIKNNNVGSKTYYGNEIVDTEHVLHSNGLIIATNEKIYKYLHKKNLKLLNLEKYCFF
ncbi:putative glycosyltransferase EpsH [Lachnospiraceae bacterium]|jgi:glycosyltransferase involved in cell wall biosynthesis|nr:putative glycosyltransferase EpsH [Lachnospiraceae bacterium]